MVIAAHKSVAELGVTGRAEDMHPSWTPSAMPPWPTWTESPTGWGAGGAWRRWPTQTAGTTTPTPATPPPERATPGPYLDGCCVRCALAARAAELVGGTEGPLGAVYEAIAAAPQPYSAHNWLRRSAAARLLGQVASGQVALTHEALDAQRPRPGADYLRHLLVANGVLPPAR